MPETPPDRTAAGERDPSPEGQEVPLHQRSIDFRAFDAGEELLVIGRLRDSRPWAEGGDSVTVVHDMELRVRVRLADLTITDSTAVMHTFPHAECPGIEEAFAGLAGLDVARGFTREVARRFGGPRGCTHLEHLARSLGPVVIQAVTSRRARAMSRQEAPDPLSGTRGPWVLDSCHVWAAGGVAEQKLAAGWRPGTGPYPAPALVTFRRTRGPT